MIILVTVTCDWASEDNDDQMGRVLIACDGGTVEASWACKGGKGSGATLLANSTNEPDERWEEVLDTPDLFQGFGDYSADLSFNSLGFAVIDNVTWILATEKSEF